MAPLRAVLAMSPARLAMVVSAGLGFGARAMETGSKFLLQLIIARTLGPSGSGNIFLALSIANVACTICRIGLDRSLTFHIATALARNEQPTLRPFLATGLAISLVLSCLLAAAMAATAGPMAGLLFHDPAFAGPMRGMAAAVVPLAMLAMVVGIFNGVSRSALAQLVGAALWPALAAVLALLVTDVETMVLVLLGAMCVATAIGLGLMWQRNLLPALAVTRAAARSLTRFAWPLFVIDTVQILLISLPTIILGMFADAGEVGVFSLANRISLILTIVLIVMAGLGSARMAAAHARDDRAALQRVMSTLLGISVLVSVPAITVLLMWAPFVLRQFGPGFEAGAGLLRLLLIGQGIGILFTCAPNVLEMTGHGWRLRRVNIAALLVNAALCFALIPPFGGLGAALATTATLVLYNTTCGVMVWRHLRVHASPLAVIRVLPWRVRVP